jgi:hypothetical protein
MSHVARLSLFAVLVACSSPKPPAVEDPAVSSAEPAPEPAAPEPTPAAPDAPTASAQSTAAPSAPSASASSDAPVVETLFVRDTLADCQAEGVRQCLQVRSSEQEDWRNFFGSIEGFQHEPSYAYELRVAVSPVVNAPADAPALRYRLLEVVAKRKAGK